MKAIQFKKCSAFIVCFVLLVTFCLPVSATAKDKQKTLLKELQFNTGTMEKCDGPETLELTVEIEDLNYACMSLAEIDSIDNPVPKDDYILTDSQVEKAVKNAKEQETEIVLPKGSTFLQMKEIYIKQNIVELSPDISLADTLTLEQLIAVKLGLGNYLTPGTDFQIGDSVKKVNEVYQSKVKYKEKRFSPYWTGYKLSVKTLPTSGLVLEKIEFDTNVQVSATLYTGGKEITYTKKQLQNKLKLPVKPGENDLEITVEYENQGESYVSYYNFEINLNPPRANLMTSFSVDGHKAKIDETKGEVTLTLPKGTDLQKIAPKVAVSKGASYKTLEKSVNFSKGPVVYQVTAKDGTVRPYIVTVKADKTAGDADTGDRANTALPTVLLLISSLAIAGVLVFKAKKRGKTLLSVLLVFAILAMPASAAPALKPLAAKWVDPVSQGQVINEKNPQFALQLSKKSDYILATQQPGESAAKMDTIIKLYDSKTGLLLALNDNYSFDGKTLPYSQLKLSLYARQYRVEIHNKKAGDDRVNAYFVCGRRDDLYFDLKGYDTTVYSKMCYDFEKLGDCTNTYNCFAYAVGIKDQFIWPWGDSPSVADVNAEMEYRGYKKVSAPTDNCVVVYGINGEVNHFARVDKGVVTAKMGEMELVKHSKIDAYYPDSEYGRPIAYYVKQ